MVNNGKYSFLLDTALPTLGFTKNKSDKKRHQNEKQRSVFQQSMIDTVNQLRHFPSVCYYTIFNEGWGQFSGSEMYDLLKSVDDTRIVDTASGWFNRVRSDVFSDHVYFKPVTLKLTGKPYVLSEFGGYTYKVPNHVTNEKKSYGYRTFTDRDIYEEAVLMLYETDVLPYVSLGMCADIYTQLSDIEEEINGLITYDREVVKIRKDRLKEIGLRIRNEING